MKKITPEYGYYTNKPNFANMVRYAIKISYTQVPYDCSTPECLSSSQVREDNVAVDVYKIFQKDKTAKMIIHCGYGHGALNSIDDFKPLGLLLKNKYHLNLLSVSQTEIMEGASLSCNRICYSILKNKYNFISPKAVFFSNKSTSLTSDSVYYFTILTPFISDFSKNYLEQNADLVKYMIILSNNEFNASLLIQTYPQKEIDIDADFNTVVPSFNYLLSKNDKKIHSSNFTKRNLQFDRTKCR